MKRSNFRRAFPQPKGACALLIGGLVLMTGASHAATAVGTASATVVDSVTVIITPPPAPVPAPAPVVVETPPALSGTIFTVESFTSSLSTSGPLLRVGVAPPSGAAGGSGAQSGAAAEGGTQGEPAAQGSLGSGAAPPAASTATVNVTRNADGSLAVSGGTGLTFAVSQPTADAVTIEYN